ncbi:MAG: fasciclin domain-containing protein [Candidatus Sumerlaeaceae bacterium]|nr:fasciclin domain-containing protein [Candidatus Sumerlaeaceae bacterium]
MKMNQITKVAAVAAVLSAFTFPAFAETCGSKTSADCGDKSAYKASKAAKGGEGEKKEAKDIVDTAVGAGSFSTLVAAVKAAGLVDVLKGEGPFTVFAPTDDAFKKLPAGTLEDLLKPENKEKLAGILKYHVVSGKVKAADVVKLKSAKSVEGSEIKITVDGDKVKVDDANVVKTDVEASNGVIHVIDAVILPKK